MGRGLLPRQGRQVVVVQTPRTPGNAEERLLAEWQARAGDPELGVLLRTWFRAGYTADAATTDPGRWLEWSWRMKMRGLGTAGYEAAEVQRGFKDPDKPGSRQEQERMHQQLEEGARPGVMSEAQKRLFERLHGLDQKMLAKTLAAYLSTAVLSRPTGFSSVGHVQADTALGRLLLHGLHVFLATFHDSVAQMRLHHRHCMSVAISAPLGELLKYSMTYAVGQDPSTFTGALPPAGAQVPLFDHLSLHWQLKLVADVVDALVVSGNGREPEDTHSSRLTLLPPDTVYHWSAFNKLLLLGMYAPVEEATAPEQQRQAAVGQLQSLATAREADALSAVSTMQESLAQFRCVLHDQLQSELAVGQAVLQLFAAQQHQQQPELLKQLQQQLQACHLPALWAQTSSGSSSGSDSQQGQQLVLLVCSLLAWQVAVLPTVDSSPSVPAQQEQQQDKSKGSPSGLHGAQQMQQLLDAVMSGIGTGPAQHSSIANSPNGIRGLLGRSLGFGAAGQAERQQQQHQQQQQQQSGQQREQPQLGTDELLISWLLQLLLTRESAQPGSQEDGAPSTEGDCQAAAGSSTGAAEAAADGHPTGGIADAVHLAPFTRGVCHVLLVRLLSGAPPCEAWSWDACLAVLRLLVSMERAAAAAAQAQYHKDVSMRYKESSSDRNGSSSSSSRSSSSSSSDEGPLTHHWFSSALWVVHPAVCIHELLAMLQLLSQANSALQDCQASGNDISGREHGSTCSHSTARQQQQQQQQEVLQFSEPTFWRSQALSLYKRKGGYAWLESFFADPTADNDKPGFWGLVGRFAAADQLNLCIADQPAALAAMPCILPEAEPAAASFDRAGQPAILGRQLARLANAQLLTKIAPTMSVLTHGWDSPVQPLALQSLLTCALTAAQQPQTLAYAGVAFSKKQEAAAVAAAAAAAAARRPRADGDGDTFYSPCASPEPGAAAAAAAAGPRPADSAAAAAAAAEAAADLWQEGFGFHLGSLLALGPLFDESQQRPCLARFMQLLLQYHEDTAAAASAALQRLTPELLRQRLWVPKPGAGSSSGGGSSSKAGTGGSSSAAGYVPAERSRLLVLLMGLYHLQMLDEQEARQQEQEWKQAQRQRDEEWARAHGFERGAQQPKQQQEEQQAKEEQQQQTDGQRQQQKNLRMLRTPSGGVAAAAAAGQSGPAGRTTDVYRDTGLPPTIISRAVDAAYAMQELLLYCLSPVDELSTRSSSSSSSGAHRLQVCGISHALMQDGAMLLAQPGPGAGLPAGVACDRCSVHTTATSAMRQLTDFGMMEMLTGRAPQPPAAERVCGDCGNAAYFCRDCSVGAPMQQHRASCGASGKGMQQAYSHILDVFTAAGGVPGNEAIPAIADGCCSCRACVDVLGDRFQRLLLRWQACPMVQYSGPWVSAHSTDDQPGAQQQQQEQQQQQQQRESGPLPRALEGPFPLLPVLQAAATCAEAGRFLQRADQTLLQAACAPLRQALANMSMACERAAFKEQEAAQGANKAAPASSPFPPPPWAGAATQQQPSPKGSPAAAAKGRVPAGLNSSLERKHRQQQQQQQKAGGGRRGMWGGGGAGPREVDPRLEQLFQEFGVTDLAEID